ncbi:magnetosome protein MamC [Maridesulfovibrio zosterae]|uniref:magnetosome protein MamC n=1 Tax=Maridesulfovibrio zosterae TaxID=82171 RepID=UPI0004133CBE|nr:magnetosome protein MamC [Maridesulfovibrio zosterae]
MTTTTRLLPIVTASAAATGALVGGTVAAVRGTIAVKEGKMTSCEAAKAVATESAGTGLATAAGVAVTGFMGIGGLAGLIGFTVIATGAKIVWDKAIPSFAGASKNSALECCTEK